MSQDLIDCLLREAQAVLAFDDALKQERAAIRAGDFQALNAVIEAKTQLTHELAQLSAARSAQMAAHGIRVGPQNELVGLDIDPGVSAAWRALVIAARNAAEANELNGAVVSAHLQFTEGALKALRERNSATVYGRNGLAQSAARGVTLASG